MKIVFSIFVVIILCGCEGAYKKQENRLVIQEVGNREGGVYAIELKGDTLKISYEPIFIDSMTFRYDSILVLHYNNSEVK